MQDKIPWVLSSGRFPVKAAPKGQHHIVQIIP